MKLTGKCKEDFYKWYHSTYYTDITKKTILNLQRLVFKSLHTSKKYGVYVDFFDSVGIHIHIEIESYGFDVDKTIHTCLLIINSDEIDDDLTRQEARTEAIEKANELYNLKK